MEKKESFIDKYAKVLVVIAVLCGAFSGSFGALISAPVQVIGFWRLTFALPFFLIIVLSSKEKKEALKKVSKKELGICLLTGFFLFAHFYSWYSAVKLTNISAAACLASFHPLVVLFITIFIYKKKVSWKSIVAILCALIGGAVIVCSDITALETSKTSGNIFAILAGIFMGIYFAIGGKVRPKMDGSVYVLIVFFGTFLSFFICNLIMGAPFFGYPPKDYLYILCLAIICQIGSHAMWNLCMGKVSPLYVSTWETMDPVFSTVLAIILVRQMPTVYEIIGCVIVVISILFYNKFERESNV